MTLEVPGTTLDLLGPQTAREMLAHDIFCFHTMAGGFEGTDAMFHMNGFKGTESHMGMRWDGFTKQWQDLRFRADANFEGNHRVISLETEDVDDHFPDWYPKGPVPRWTPQQVAKIIVLVRVVCSKEFHANCPNTWACHKFGIPIKLVANSGANQRGIAYHRQGIDGDFTGPYKGRQGVGEHWSTSGGKVCPGDQRITQLINDIIPAAARAQGADMTEGEHNLLVTIGKRSEAMYKALRNDPDADQKLVTGIRDHFKFVIDEESTRSGSDLRTMVGEKSEDGALAAITASNTPNTPETPTP